jgi:hypothetical protein
VDELDSKIATILARFDLPADAAAIERVREDVDIALDAARETAALKLPKDAAIDFVNAVKLIIRIARDYGLASEQQLLEIRRMGKQANVRLALTDKPIRRQWLGPCVANFRGAWEAITTKPSGLHYGDDPSPALAFVTACCQIVDPEVNASAALRAYRDFLSVREMTEAEYAEFCQSDLWRKLSRSDL